MATATATEWQSCPLSAKGLVPACGALVHRTPDRNDTNILSNGLTWPPQNTLFYDFVESIHQVTVYGAYLATEVILSVTALFLMDIVKPSGNKATQMCLSSSMDHLMSIANKSSQNKERRLSSRWYTDGRWIHQILRSCPDKDVLPWWEGVKRILTLVLTSHFGVVNLQYIRQSSGTDKRTDMTRLKFILDTSSKEPIRQHVLDFYQLLSMSTFKTEWSVMLQQINKSINDEVATDLLSFLESNVMTTNVTTPPALPHVRIGLAGEYMACGYFPNMPEIKVDANAYKQYLEQEQEINKWTTLLKSTFIKHNVAVITTDKTAMTATTDPSATLTDAKIVTDVMCGRKRSTKRKAKVFTDLIDEVVAGNDSDVNTDKFSTTLQLLLDRSSPPKRRHRAKTVAEKKHEKDAQDEKDEKDEKGVSDEEMNMDIDSLSSKREVSLNKSIGVDGVDELGRCFVYRPCTLQGLVDRHRKDEKDVYMFSVWNKRSHVLHELSNDAGWRHVSPLPESVPGLEMIIGSCLNAHLGVTPLADSYGHLILNGAPDVDAYTEQAIYLPDRCLRPAFMEKLDLAYLAMINQGDITTHKEVLAYPGLRGYFVDVWLTTVLNGKKAITPASLAFICSVLVYCMDSNDPGDHIDYKSINQILYHYTERCLNLPDELSGRPCLHKGLSLCRIHPLSEGVDKLGFGPRLIMWMINSQRLTALESDDSGTDRYPPVKIAPSRGLNRWIDIVTLVANICALHLQSILTNLTGGNYLTMLDLLRLALPANTHNATVKTLTDQWTENAISCDIPFVHDKDHPDAKKAHELWNIAKNDVKPLVSKIHTILVRLIGCESNRKAISKWFYTVTDLILRERTIKSADKILLSQFTTFFAGAIDTLKIAKFERCCASIVQDVVKPTTKTTSYKVIYVPKTNKHSFQTVKVDTPTDANKRLVMVKHMVEVHKWKYKLKLIERTAQDKELLPGSATKVFLSSINSYKEVLTDVNLTEIERKFDAARIAQWSVSNNNHNNTIALRQQLQPQQPLTSPAKDQKEQKDQKDQKTTFVPSASLNDVIGVAKAAVTQKPLPHSGATQAAVTQKPLPHLGATQSAATQKPLPHLGATQAELMTDAQLRMEEQKQQQYLQEPILHHLQLRERPNKTNSCTPPAFPSVSDIEVSLLVHGQRSQTTLLPPTQPPHLASPSTFLM